MFDFTHISVFKQQMSTLFGKDDLVDTETANYD